MTIATRGQGITGDTTADPQVSLSSAKINFNEQTWHTLMVLNLYSAIRSNTFSHISSEIFLTLRLKPIETIQNNQISVWFECHYEIYMSNNPKFISSSYLF